MSQVDVGCPLENLLEWQQELDQWIRIVANAAGGRLVGNNNRDNHQEKLLGDIGDALMGLKGEMKKDRNNTQQIQDKQTQLERKMEEEKNNVSGEMKKGNWLSEATGRHASRRDKGGPNNVATEF